MQRTQAIKLFGLAALGLALGACQAIAGIDERTLDPTLAVTTVSSKQCKDYCTTVLENCTGTNAVYNDMEGCLGFCRFLEPGDSLEPEPNTVACRLQQAEFADREPDVHCAAAGPGGADVCGSDCDAYCTVFPEVCPDDYLYGSTEQCLAACAGLIDQDSFDVKRDHDGDTIECRLVHTVSSTTLPDLHCGHAPIPPVQPWCTGAADKAPTCEQYCKVQLAACQGEFLQYESPEQCEAACNALDPGNNADQNGNTVGCRRYHAFSSTLQPAGHCYHSGPTGDGHCGDAGAVADGHSGNCDSYCQLLSEACPTDLTAMGGLEDCKEACLTLPEAARDSEYSVTTAAAGKGLSCRVLFTLRAFEDSAACASAIGGDQCEPD